MRPIARTSALALLATTALSTAALSTSASAADMRRPIYKGPPAVMQTAYNWTGFYLGGHVGGAFAEEKVSNLVSTSFPADIDSEAMKDSPSGVMGGAQIGYNWQAGNVVYGIEGDWSASNIDDVSPVPYSGVGGTELGFKHNWYALATGRVGLAYDNFLIYVKGGAAWADIEYSAITGPFSTTASDTRTGWTIGGGVEWGVAGPWSLKIEYNYLDFGKETLDRFNDRAEFDTQVHLVKFGINYRFGSGGIFGAGTGDWGPRY